MKTMLLSALGLFAVAIYRSADGGSGGGGGDGGAPGSAPVEGAPPAADPAKDAASTLYGDGKDGDAKPPAGDGKADDAAGKDGKAEWKEYVADATKSAEENARLKAEHDKTKPEVKPGETSSGTFKVEDLKMPAGVELDKPLADALAPIFNELKVDGAGAQKLADAYIKVKQAEADAWADTQQKWVETAKADKEIGGGKWDDSVFSARKAIDKLGTPALKQFLETSGGGNHPEVIRILSKAGKLIADDKPVVGDAAGSGPQDTLSILYPT